MRMFAVKVTILNIRDIRQMASVGFYFLFICKLVGWLVVVFLSPRQQLSYIAVGSKTDV